MNNVFVEIKKRWRFFTKAVFFFSIVFLTFVFLPSNVFLQAWVNPTGNDLPRPLHVGTDTQTKSGNLFFDGGTRYIGTSSNHDFRIRTNALDRLTILSGGNVGIGTIEPDEKLHIEDGGWQLLDRDSNNETTNTVKFGSAERYGVSGAGRYDLGFMIVTGANPRDFWIKADSGTIRLRTDEVMASAFYYSSDIRLKENIKPLDSSLSKVLRLDPISYKMREGEDRIRLGFSAQDVKKVFPEVVTEDGDGYLSIEGTGLIAPLVGAMKEQQMWLNYHRKKIENLENQIEELKDQVENLMEILKMNDL